MIHYHGTPITPRAQLLRMKGRHFCVSHAAPWDAKTCLEIGQSVMFDNGAFSAFTKKKAFNADKFYSWVEPMLVPPHWGVLPDVIGGTVEDQHHYLARFPYRTLGYENFAGVWHLNLPFSHLFHLCNVFPKVCLGSSGEFWKIGSDAWRRRMDETFDALIKYFGKIPYIHGMRMLGQSSGPWPLASADSTNVAQNFKRDTGCAECKAAPIDARQPAPRWRLYDHPKPKAADDTMTPILKDKDGARLLKKFSMPRNPTKGDARLRIRPEDDPDDADRLYSYCETDVKAEAAIAAECPELTGEELEFYLCNEEMNARGVGIDTGMVECCIAVVQQVLARCDADLHALTGGLVSSVNELEVLKAWLRSQGVAVDSLDAEHLAALLAGELPPPARRALEIRQMAGSSSVKKLYAMRNQATRAGRLHDMFTYNGARTGRVVGRGPQPTNLPVSGPPVRRCGACDKWHAFGREECPWCGAVTPLEAEPDEWGAEAAECALTVLATRSASLVEYYFGHALDTVAGCLRALFTAAPGHDLIGSDYNSIEAVVQACLTGEQWRIEVFRTHGKIYEMSASKITGIPFDDLLAYRKDNGKHHPSRKLGKVAELASGYGGWVGSWVAFDADDFMNEDEIKDAVIAWRNASPAIVHMWGGQQDRDGMPCFYGLEGAAVQAVLYPGVEQHVTRLDGTPAGITYQMRGDALFCRLPSGRELTYHRPRLEPQERYGRTTWALSFEGYNTNPTVGPKGWIRIRTYGGRLFENVCQAIARDVLRRAIVRLERCGYPLVMQVYDEVVCEVLQGVGSLSQVESIMGGLPEWCRDWPIRASGGWRGRRFRK